MQRKRQLPDVWLPIIHHLGRMRIMNTIPKGQQTHAPNGYITVASLKWEGNNAVPDETAIERDCAIK